MSAQSPSIYRTTDGRIQVRHSDAGDIGAIRAIYSQPSCFANTLQHPFPSLEKWQRRLGDLPENCYSLVAEIDGEVVGQAGMEVFVNPRRKHVANLGMAVSEDYQGIGVGSALLAAMMELAHNWLAVRRIELEVYTDNHAAIKLYKRHGFVIEGEAIGYAFRGGEYVDAFLMASCRDFG
ncbi:GNAT family N-acetyltransferase [Shewanella litorisediminis]|uniref:GNAT family N-acetyltransferase n=1 Tax=Shewanella litorisediminis TaxID=1173586 RepID=A0ABX7G160_9GAMM|nr:GNAT family N-acetyltransferase [Shewanella litorisediminis]MCL2918982.1 GNAT family N-acetyltransferase [Shewanella litorisediminis]QRH01049.1 GNAT family N-acetyltransferase [Shewanella litorisediminis]